MSGQVDEERVLNLAQRWPKTSVFLLSSSASIVAEIATFPLDVTKTRLQMQGEAAFSRFLRVATPYRGMLDTTFGIIREEGFLKLWQGIIPAVYRQIVYTGFRMVVYEYYRDGILEKSEYRRFSLLQTAIGGMLSGAFAQFLSNPADLVKVQLQMEGKRKLQGKALRRRAQKSYYIVPRNTRSRRPTNPNGVDENLCQGAHGQKGPNQSRYRGVHHAFLKILKEGGIVGLWVGWVPNVQRAALVNMGDIATYESVKRFLKSNTSLEDGILIHITGSTCSGLVTSILGTPADVIKSRLMNQPTDKNGKGLLYKSSVDCLIQSVQGEGFLSLYKGFLPSWLRMVPWSLVFWLTYEKIRYMSGVNPF
ncbi:mitochondrial uncoupling protein 4 isoform X1 [Monodelphis domestica]|uniref:mitochondrial uncoupling protein 4 isoform X1 n=1 Tax=Monodelphis domestica TaxID=13616 RepID=UPI00044331AE|nr:mitochondrial uncoupling protein 4 isoform X1 [Monodelphis domestica]